MKFLTNLLLLPLLLPYNKSCIDQACLAKMAGYWPHFVLHVHGPQQCLVGP